MRVVCIDAGHGGSDPGGQSLGTPEKTLALRYALRLGMELGSRGLTVHQTRTLDVYPSLGERADLANRVGAKLFVSVHANASGNAKASGPWTIHAKGSKRGEEIARALQWAMVSVFGGNPEAVYPDESPWVGDRRLAVLRQTKMPAVLLELGFMTNAGDLAKMENPQTERRACAALADAIALQLGVALHDAPEIEPEISVPTPSPPRAPTEQLILDRIEVPRPEHVTEILRVRQFTPEMAAAGLSVAEVLLRGVQRAASGDRAAAVKSVADALADWLKSRHPPAA